MLVQETAPEERAQLEEEVNGILDTWNHVSKEVDERETKLNVVGPAAERYQDDLDKLAAVMAQIEDKLLAQKAFGPEPQKILAEKDEIKVGAFIFVFFGCAELLLTF